MPGPPNDRVNIHADKLQRQWWNGAIETVGSKIGLLTDYEREFYMTVSQALDMNPNWQPTRKQWNFLRDLARKIS